ncbi:thiol:disulfide interchange protein [Salinimicrobium marinum]|uniref:Thiol:disulfide interchange protein n=2 Tax=Salinimicrobium marinum TaxID=680283 RepID=A0A918VWG9_9FLAO|nr:thiol:disulfide interchange protein [Salinimicrobium marinum]
MSFLFPIFAKIKFIMRKILFIGVLSLLVSCQEESGYSISGTIENATDGQKIYVAELNENNNQTTTIDTMEIKDGKFSADLPEKEKPTLSFLTIEGARGNVLFVADNNPIEFKIYKDSLFSSEVSGGEDNEILYSYIKDARKANQIQSENRTAMIAAFRQNDSMEVNRLQLKQEELSEQHMNRLQEIVKENPNSLVSAMILQEIANSKMVPSSELKELYNSLSTEVQNSNLGKMADTTISQMSKVEIGSKAPEFTAPTPDGEELALKDALGKVTLVDFWASWCKPCRDENPNIVRVYEKYHDKGLNILGVSLDRPGQKDKWEQAISEDNLQWNHVSNLMFWQDPVAAEYGIRAIPAAFLLDENGVIIAKDLRGKDLENKVAELLD